MKIKSKDRTFIAEELYHGTAIIEGMTRERLSAGVQQSSVLGVLLKVLAISLMVKEKSWSSLPCQYKLGTTQKATQ